jgi:hypothetical protein
MNARATIRVLLSAALACCAAGTALAQGSLDDRASWRGSGLRLDPAALSSGKGWGARFELQSFGRYELAPRYSLLGGTSEAVWQAPGYRLRWSYDLGARSSLGISFASGRDAEDFMSQEIAPGRRWSLFGRYWLAPDWALSAEALTPGEGNLLRRPTIRLGVQRQF